MAGRKLSIGIFAHVDAGKTTLAENILFRAGVLRRMGRVDHKDTYFDSNDIEKSRGITIFSVSASFELGDIKVTLLDTPGHVDFSAEAERVMPVLDAVILVISASDGVQSHTKTLWQLFLRYGIPVFIFVNKMDMPGADMSLTVKKLKRELGDGVIYLESEDFEEEASLTDESALEEYLESGRLADATISRLIASRKLFPAVCGSALKDFGVDNLLKTVEKYAPVRKYRDDFCGRVYKITRDRDGNRLTHLKVTGGVLRAKDVIRTGTKGEQFDEKIDQIRVYSGNSFKTVTEASSGDIIAVTGPEHTAVGEGLGGEEVTVTPQLAPVLKYKLLLPDGTDTHGMYKKLLELSEEIPELSVGWNDTLKTIELKVMGEIQLEVIKTVISERYGAEVGFDKGNIVYKETITGAVEGVGHYEPLRHYAEVHLLMEPLPRGEGLIFGTACRTEMLEKNWQRLVLTHLMEKEHLGVLMGAPITDMRITLIAGRAHEKHTEGGDFRESTYRAIRHGLMQAKSVLLEPYYEYELIVPQDKVGRAMSDLRLKNGTFDVPEQDGELSIIRGRAPVASIGHYASEVAAYTSGNGRLSLRPCGYDTCHNTEEVLAEAAYDPLADLANPAASIFCSHGAGMYIEWDRVRDFMHINTGIISRITAAGEDRSAQDGGDGEKSGGYNGTRERSYEGDAALDKELEEIFKRTYGEEKRKYKPGSSGEVFKKPDRPYVYKRSEKANDSVQYLLVDGYNIIFAWDELKDVASASIDAARGMLADILCNYRSTSEQEIILVFDAYRLSGHSEEIVRYVNIDIVYTKEAETADQYIERTAHALRSKGRVFVATSDAIEQIIIFGAGAIRMSAKDLYDNVQSAGREISEYCKRLEKGKYLPFDDIRNRIITDLSGDGSPE